MVERVSHNITLHKPLARISDPPPKEECMDYHMQQQSKETLGWIDSERSLMDEGAPDVSCDQQPLHPDREPECARQPDKVQDMEATQDYNKSVASATATVKKRILEETNKSIFCCCCCIVVVVVVCMCACVCAYARVCVC